jgi:hypothetical protein
MGTFGTALAAALATALMAGASLAATSFSATLTGDQEAPPSGSTLTGSASFQLLGAGTASPSLAFEMLFHPAFDFGLPGGSGTQQVVSLHIHQAPRGVNGGVVFGIRSPDSDTDMDTAFELLGDGSTRITGEWDADEGFGTTFAALAPAFLASTGEVGFYVNLHTTDFPAGEIRGQIAAAPIPLPTTLPLLAGGVVLLGAWRRARMG